MIFKLKWTFLILIIHIRLHDLKSTTIFNRYKTVISDNSNYSNNHNNIIGKNNHIPFIDGISKVYNNNNIQIFDNKNVLSLKPTTNTNNQQTLVADIFNTVAASTKPKKQVKKSCSNNERDNENSSCDNDNANFTNDKNLNDTFESSTKVEASEFVNVPWRYIANDQDPSLAINENLSIRSDQTKIESLKSEVVNGPHVTPKLNIADSYYQYNSTKNASEENMESLHDAEETTKLDKVQIVNFWENVFNVGDLLRKYSSGKNNKCLMHKIRGSIQWWSFQNGTLRAESFENKKMEHSSNYQQYIDLSYNNITNDATLYLKSWLKRLWRNITDFSVAYNSLKQIPFRTLTPMAGSLRRLTLKGNSFNNETDITWATFPIMPELIELDISDCSIEYIEHGVFVNITGLRKLYMSHNNLHIIPYDTFDLLNELEYIDLSYTNLKKIDIQPNPPTIDSIRYIFGSVKIEATAFKKLTKLVYLDLSHTKMSRSSALAFTNLTPSLKYLSLCYSFLPIAGHILFKNTRLVGLDLSGNPYAGHTIMGDGPFEVMSDTLKYLFFEESNLKTLQWLKNMKNLQLLSLKGNYIYGITPYVFGKLRNLRALDLSDNIISNWYGQIFKNNTELRLLNLRHNNLNIINSEMVKDFSTLDYLSLGDNIFLCDCILRDLMAVAAINNKKAKCLDNLFMDMPDFTETPAIDAAKSTLRNLNSSLLDSLLISNHFMRYVGPLEKSFENLRNSNINARFPRMRYIAHNGLSILRSTLEDTTECGEVITSVGPFLNGTKLKFQLIDYENELYWCFNGTKRVDLVGLNCDINPLNIDIAVKINKLTQIAIISICSLLSVTLLLVIVYLKRWHIYYYYSSLKSAALLSVATKDQLLSE
ncbi:toll-like receptor 8 isoform X2 [Eurosta solidaginis]|uniref:toll-like receptor 8 isoform X2 n=1 Tax=Eurosta solidaginis TaxID=178769 RepID=UPI003530D622